MAVVVDRAERLVDLDEPAVRQPPDDAGLHAVREHLAVVLLQAQADAGTVMKYTSGGRTSRPMRPAQVIALRLMWNLSAITSLPPDSVATMKNVNAIAPTPTRSGASRGPLEQVVRLPCPWSSRASMNG